MWNIDREKAKAAGYTDQEIDAYIEHLNSRAPAPTPPQVNPEQPTSSELLGQTPDVVSPFPTPAPVTQSFDNYNPNLGYYDNLHKGVDFATNEGDPGTNMIGGQVRLNEFDPAYGYRLQVEGLNPQEYQDLSKEEFVGGKTGEDVVAMNHLQNPAINPKTGQPYKAGEYVATGEAKLNFGSTGNSLGPHLDIESFPQGEDGNYSKYRDVMRQYRMKKLLGLL